MRLNKILLMIGLIGLCISNFGNPNSIIAAEKADLNAVFLVACENGDQAKVAKLLSEGVDINASNQNEESGLVLACSKGEASLVKLLLQQKGIEVNAADQWEDAALHKACEKNYPEIATLLLEHGADLEQKNNREETPLLVACQMGNYPIVKRLLAKGADVHVQPYPSKKTALHRMSEVGFMEGMQWLVAQGADVNVRDAEGKTALHAACANGQDGAVRWLLANQADLNIQDYMGASVLHEACKAGYSKLVELLIDWGIDIDCIDCNGKTPLQYACGTGKKQVVETLLKLGADLNAKDYEGGTALHHACYHGQVEVAEMLISKGLTANTQDNHGITPLHLACYQGQLRMVQKLLALGVSVNAADERGKTALDLTEQGGGREIAQRLIAKQAKKGASKKGLNSYWYQNYQIDKTPILIEKITYSIMNTDSSFWEKTNYPKTEQLHGFFYIYIRDLAANRTRIKEVSIWSEDDHTRWRFPSEKLKFMEGYLEFGNLSDTIFSKDRTLFQLHHFRVEIVTFDGRVDGYLVDIPEPGSLAVNKKFVYSPSYRGKVSSEYVKALQTAKFFSAKLTSQKLELCFKVNDSRVFNGSCSFYDQNKQYIGATDNWINVYSREVIRNLNQGQGFYTNDQMNRLQLAVSDITFEESKDVSDIRYVMVYLQDGAQFKDSKEPDDYVYASRSKLFPCKIE